MTHVHRNSGGHNFSIRKSRPAAARSMWRLALLALLFLFLLSACAATPPPKDNAVAPMDPWPHEISDLSPDPTIRFGRLANGFRYVLKENKTPSDRVSMHLYVRTGSLMEADQQQGIAHFLEHMQFNGSKRFAPDELVMYFQRIGMQFGPDANAHTGFNQTVYDILLPRGDRQSLAEAMLVLHEFAQEALLLPEQIEKEKKVVESEMRSRDSAAYRAMKAELSFELPGTLPPRRFPIGEPEAIRNFNQAMLKDYYDTWYRPENMVLIVVGQFDSATAQDLAAKQFSGLRARAAPVAKPQLGSFHHQGLNVFYYPDKTIGNATVRIETAEAREQPADMQAERRNILLETLAEHMMSNRLSKMLNQPDSPATDADIGSGYFLQQFQFTSIAAESEPAKWPQALQAIEQLLRQALTYGFSASELERAKKAYQAQLQQAVETESTRDSSELAMMLMGHLGADRVTLSAAEQQQLLLPVLENVSIQEVNANFAESWADDHRLVLLTGDADLSGMPGSPESAIAELYSSSAAHPVEPLTDETSLQFPYLPEPATPGVISRQSVIEELATEQVWFDNGLRLALKKTPYKDGEALVSLTFGKGKTSEPIDQPGLVQLTQALLNEAGFGAINRDALEQALAGRLAEIRLDVRDDLCALEGNAAREEIPLLFELLYTFIQDPGYRPETLALVKRRLEQQYLAAIHEVDGMMGIAGVRFLAGGDQRFGMADAQQLQALNLDDIKAWFDAQLAIAPLEIAVVGDIDPEQIKSLTARWFGSLPAGKARDLSSDRRPGPTFPVGESSVLETDSKIENALVVVAYPTSDMWDIQRTRRLGLLSEVFSERLRVRIREKLGAAYSPFAYNHSYRAYENYGLLQIHLQLDPRQTETVIEEVKRIAETLRGQVIADDEFRRALDPTLTRIKDLRQSNRYWLGSVLSGSGRYPQQLEWARTIELDYAAITAAEIRALAEQYLDNSKAAVVIVKPKQIEESKAP